MKILIAVVIVCIVVWAYCAMPEGRENNASY